MVTQTHKQLTNVIHCLLNGVIDDHMLIAVDEFQFVPCDFEPSGNRLGLFSAAGN
jgi:hypothetical protein